MFKFNIPKLGSDFGGSEPLMFADSFFDCPHNYSYLKFTALDRLNHINEKHTSTNVINIAKNPPYSSKNYQFIPFDWENVIYGAKLGLKLN